MNGIQRTNFNQFIQKRLGLMYNKLFKILSTYLPKPQSINYQVQPEIIYVFI